MIMRLVPKTSDAFKNCCCHMCYPLPTVYSGENDDNGKIYKNRHAMVITVMIIASEYVLPVHSTSQNLAVIDNAKTHYTT